jgi:hypothetical protein
MKTEYYQSLPSWAKGAVAVAVIAGIGIIGFVIYKNFKPRTKEEKELDKDEDTFISQGQKPSFPKSQYTAFADTIQQENLSWNTDEEKIYGIFKQMKNDLDIVMLIQAFGERRPQFTINTGMALVPFLNEDLNRSEIGEINKILAAKNIKFRF